MSSSSYVTVNITISRTIQLLKQIWFLLARKDSQTKGFFGQLDDFDQDIVVGNAASDRQEIILVNKGTNDRDFIVSTSSNNTAVNESTVNVNTLEICFNERIDREMSNIVDTVEDRIQNAILTAIDNIVAPKIELAIRSINASSGRDATGVSANSERTEHVRNNTSFENASGNDNILHVTNVNDETRHNIPDEVSELSVPETHFDRQPHTHHNVYPENFGGLDALNSLLLGLFCTNGADRKWHRLRLTYLHVFF